MNLTLFLIVIGAISVACIWIGRQASKEVKTNDDYFLMKRNLKIVPLVLTFLATQVGGGTIMGSSQEAFDKGWIVLLYPLGTCLGFFALALGIGKKWKELGVSTTAEIFEKVYQAKFLRTFASAVSIITLFLILVAQGIAAYKFFYALGFKSDWIFITFWGVLIAYTTMGGFKAVVKTDVLQASFVIGSLLLALIFFKAPSASLSLEPVTLAVSKLNFPWISWLLMPFLFMTIEQDMGQRCFAAENSRTVKISTILAGIFFMGICLIPIYFGVMAKKLAFVPFGSGSVLMMFINQNTPMIVSTLFMGAIFMAIVSTAVSLLSSIGSNIAFDFLGRYNMQDKRKVAFSKGVTLLCGLSSLLIVFYFDNIVNMIIFSYELSVCALCVPTVIGLISKKPSRYGAIVSSIVGFLSLILFKIMGNFFLYQLISLGLSLSAYYVGAGVANRIIARHKKEQLLS